MKQVSGLLVVLFCFFLSAGEVELEFDFSSPDPLTAAITRGAEKAYEINMAGLDALESGDIPGAELHFKEAMSLIPLYSDAQNNLAVVYFRTNRVDSAVALWKSITVSDEEYHLSWYNLALHSFENKKFERAIGFLKKAEKYNPRFSAAKFLRGQCYYELGDHKKSGTLLAESHKIDPENLEILEYYALYSLEVGDTAKALSLLKSKNSVQMISLRGEILALQGNYEAALPLLESVKEQDTSGGVQEVLVDIYLDMGEMEKALQLIKSSKRVLDTLPVSMWINAAFTLSEQGKPKEAIKWLNKAYLVHEDPDILYNLGQLHYRMGQFDKVVDFITRLPETYRDGQSFYILANAYMEIGEQAKAKEALYSALYYETNPLYYAMLGTLMKAAGEIEGAKIQFQKALALDAGLEDAKIELALLNEGGDYGQLIAVLEKRLKGCKKCYDEQKRLALLYQLSGNIQKGIALIENIAHKDRDLSMTLFYILERSGDHQRAKKVLQKAHRKRLLIDEDLYIFAQFLSEYRYFRESEEVCLNILKKETTLADKCYYLLGYNNMKMRRYKRARTYLEKAYAIDSKSVSVKSTLAFVLQKLGDNARAETLWQRSVKEEESSVNYINLGLLSFQKQEYEKALSFYNKAMTLEKNSALHINVGNCYYELGKYGRAFDSYQQALFSTDSVEALAGMYWAAKKNGNGTGATSALNRIAVAPFTNASRRVMADVTYEKKEFAKAKEYLLALDSLDGEDCFMLSRTLLELKDIKKAQSYADSAVSRGVQKEAIRTHLQALAYAAGDYEKANSYSGGSSLRDMYNRAVLLYETKSYAEYLFFLNEKLAYFDGEDAVALVRMAGDCAVFLKKWDELLYWSKRLYTMQKSAMAAYNCAVAAYNLDDIATSFHFYKKAQELDSSIKNSDIENRYINQNREKKPAVETGLSRTDSLFNSAIVFHRKGELDKAENIYNVILELDDRYHRAWNNLGIIYGERGDIDMAVKCYKSSIAKRSDIADGFINLVYLYIAIEEYSQAEKWLKKGLKKHSDNKQLKQFQKDLAKLE